MQRSIDKVHKRWGALEQLNAMSMLSAPGSGAAANGLCH